LQTQKNSKKFKNYETKCLINYYKNNKKFKPNKNFNLLMLFLFLCQIVYKLNNYFKTL